MAECAAIKTPLTADELRDGLACAWMARFGEPPSHATLAVLLAQSALETGYWHSCVAFNIGNAKAVAGGNYDWTYFSTWEVLPEAEVDRLAAASTVAAPARKLSATKIVVSPKHPMCCFRAFADLEDGCGYYLDLLCRRFTKAWDSVVGGDLVNFVTQLKAEGYFTAPLGQYIDGACHTYGVICLPWLGGGTIAQFQAANGLKADNDCGPDTVNAMRPLVAALDAPAPDSAA